jgi:HSP20 family protein
MTTLRLNRFPFNQVLDQFLNETLDQVVAPAVKNVLQRPATNIKENDKTYIVELVAPGFTKDDLKISLDKNQLTISAQKEQTESEAANNFKHREFHMNSFERSFTLPESVDQTSIEAKFENGILVVHLPKKAELVVEPKTISIN